MRLFLLTVLAVMPMGVLLGCAPSPQQPAKTSIERLGGKTRSDKGQVVKIDLRKSRATDNDLQNKEVSDEGLATLKTMPKLTQVYIHGSRITAAGAQALQADLPKLTIEKFPVAPLGPDFR